jgi:hypothetical protein
MMNNKHQQWWDNLSPQMQDYLKRQPIWHDRDMYKAATVGSVIGFFVGLIVGYEWAWRPVVTVFKPLAG